MSFTQIIISIIFFGFLVASGLLALGYVLLADPDRAWRWMQANSQRRGIAPDELLRTHEWDQRTAIIGIMLICIGSFLMIFLMLSMIG